MASGSSLDLVRALRSHDKPTRRAARWFILTSLAAIFVVIFGTRYIILKKHFEDQKLKDLNVAENLGDFLEHTQAEGKTKIWQLGLGEFTIDVFKPLAERTPYGVINMAQVEVWLECDVKETCEWLEGHVDQARNEVSNALVNVARDEILTREGKRRIKRAIMDRINQWLKKGKIDAVYFSKLVLG